MEDAKDRCISEGADLILIENDQQIDQFFEVLDHLSGLFDIYESIEKIWIGGFLSLDSNITFEEGLTLLREEKYVYKTFNATEILPYACMLKCVGGYEWFHSVQNCIKVIDSDKMNSGNAKYVFTVLHIFLFLLEILNSIDFYAK